MFSSEMFYSSGSQRWNHGYTPKINLNILTDHHTPFELIFNLSQTFTWLINWMRKVLRPVKGAPRSTSWLQLNGWEPLFHRADPYLRDFTLNSSIFTTPSCVLMKKSFEKREKEIRSNVIKLDYSNLTQIKYSTLDLIVLIKH